MKIHWRQYKYNLGRQCTVCNTPIKNDNKSGFCVKHAPSPNNRGRIPSNKGKTYEDMFGVEKAEQLKSAMRERAGDRNPLFGKPRSAEVKDKISKANKGKKRSTEAIKNISEAHKNPSQEIRNNLRLKNLGKKQSVETIEKRRNKLIGLKRSVTTKNILRASKLGSKNPMWGKHPSNWRGGIESIRQKIKESPFYKQWRQDVFIRDGFTCRLCNTSPSGYLRAHHIKHFAVLLQEAAEYLPLIELYDAAMIYTPLWDASNGLTVCEDCHKKLHKMVKL